MVPRFHSIGSQGLEGSIGARQDRVALKADSVVDDVAGEVVVAERWEADASGFPG